MERRARGRRIPACLLVWACRACQAAEPSALRQQYLGQPQKEKEHLLVGNHRLDKLGGRDLWFTGLSVSGPAPPIFLSPPENAEGERKEEPESELSKKHSFTCMVFTGSLVALVLLTFFSGSGQGPTWVAGVLLAILAWTAYTGLQKAWFAGGVQGACRVTCMYSWFVLLLLPLSIPVFAGLLAIYFCGLVAVNLKPELLDASDEDSREESKAAKHFKEQFNERKTRIPRLRRDFYASEAFKDKCDRLFEKADPFGYGRQSVKKLLPATTAAFGGCVTDEDLVHVFNQHTSSEIRMAEFRDMCKIFCVLRFPGDVERRTPAQHLEFFGLREESTSSDFALAYGKLVEHCGSPTLKEGESPEMARAKQEVSYSHEALQKYFAEAERPPPVMAEP